MKAKRKINKLSTPKNADCLMMFRDGDGDYWKACNLVQAIRLQSRGFQVRRYRKAVISYQFRWGAASPNKIS